MRTSVLGFITLGFVFVFCLSDRGGNTHIGFFDIHAGVVVFGGVLGSLLIALNKSALMQMAKIFFANLFGRSSFEKENQALKAELAEIRDACRTGKRTVLFDYIEKSAYPEIRAACEIILAQSQGPLAAEKFTGLKQQYLSIYEPIIEGWDLVARLAPSFGMVGTVTGMVQLFRNMSTSTGNLGGSMGMALLATLYGIAFGAAVGGPMSTRTNNELNDKLNMIDLCEATVGALIQEFRQGEKK